MVITVGCHKLKEDVNLLPAGGALSDSLAKRLTKAATVYAGTRLDARKTSAS